jgi:hypothetical protein
MDVTPTFYTEDGDAIVGDSFQMQSAEVKTVDLKTLMPHRIQNRQNLGGMTLSYFGYPLEMWAQLRLMHVERGGSVDVTFVNLKDQRSNERNAVWQAPAHSHATLAIGNVGSETLNAELRFSSGELQSVQVAPFGTAPFGERGPLGRRGLRPLPLQLVKV